MSFGKDDTKETTQSTEPWKDAQPHLRDVLGQAQTAFGQGQNFLRENPASPLYNKALGGLDTLMSGSGPLSALSSAANGDMLDITKSPLWGSMTGGIQDAVNSQFSAAGRTGSPAHAGVMTSELGKLAGQLYGQERSNQLNAANSLGGYLQSGIGMAPGLYNSLGTADLNNMWQNLSRYGSIAQGIGGMGGSGTATETVTDNFGVNDLLSLIATGVGAYAGSDRNQKKHIQPAETVLGAINAVPVYTYRYKPEAGDGGAEPRIGPMAQDWAAQFGGDGKTIPMPQIVGALVLAVQELSRKIDALEAA